jgi:hypothetical protein
VSTLLHDNIEALNAIEQGQAWQYLPLNRSKWHTPPIGSCSIKALAAGLEIRVRKKRQLNKTQQSKIVNELLNRLVTLGFPPRKLSKHNKGLHHE